LVVRALILVAVLHLSGCYGLVGTAVAGAQTAAAVHRQQEQEEERQKALEAQRQAQEQARQRALLQRQEEEQRQRDQQERERQQATLARWSAEEKAKEQGQPNPEQEQLEAEKKKLAAERADLEAQRRALAAEKASLAGDQAFAEEEPEEPKPRKVNRKKPASAEPTSPKAAPEPVPAPTPALPPAPLGANEYLTKQGYLAALTEELLDKATSYAVEKDEEALERIVATNTVFPLKPGVRVVVTETHLLGGKVKIRPKGQLIEVWVPMEAIGKGK